MPRNAPAESPWHPTTPPRPWFGAVWLVAFVAVGCSTIEPKAAADPGTTAIVAAHQHDSLVHLAKRTRAEGRRFERRGIVNCVDRYYKAAVLASAALEMAPRAGEDDELLKIRDLYNDSLGDCLRAAQAMGRLDPRSGLVVNGPAGSMTVPIAHVGFVWGPEDFGKLLAPEDVSRLRNTSGRRLCPGLGAGVGVERPNPHASASDEFLPDVSAFNATAVLRPDLDAWLGAAAGERPPADVLELIDPLRSRTTTFAARAWPLAANLEVGNARLQEIQEATGAFAIAGFTYPERELDRAGILMLEPFQPGKIPVVLVHGLLADPFIFNEMIIALQRSPGFLDRFQIWVYSYPTGATLLRVAAILRGELGRATAAFDPAGVDPGMQNVSLVGFSLGGLLCRLQISSSGDALWRLMAKQPLETMSLSPEARGMAQDLFFFEPVPNVRQVIFLATPHGGVSPALRGAARTASRFIRRPADTEEFIAEADQNNPGALTDTARNLPSSIEAMANRGPLLQTIRRLPINPHTSLETIAGLGLLGPNHPKGDLVVPLPSAHLAEADAEFWVRAVHNTIYRKPETIATVRRLLMQGSGTAVGDAR